MSGAEHVLRDGVIVVHGPALVVGDDRHFRLVQHVRSGVIAVALLAPADDGAGVARGQRLEPFRQTGVAHEGGPLDVTGQPEQRHVVVDRLLVVPGVLNTEVDAELNLRPVRLLQVVFAEAGEKALADAVGCG